jgi:hypothetical protein
MIGIPANQKQRLIDVLLRCGGFTSQVQVKAIFIDARLSPWRNKLPEGNSPTERVNLVIEFLSDKFSDRDENALVLFLRVLSELCSSSDACHKALIDLANEIEQVLTVDSVKRIRQQHSGETWIEQRKGYILWIIADLIVIFVIFMAFIIEDWGVEQSIIYTFAGILVIVYGFWLVIKLKPKSDGVVSFLLTLIVYGVFGPVFHLVKTIYELVSHKEK